MPSRRFRSALIALLLALPQPGSAQDTLPRLHHVHLNTVDVDAAVAWYLSIWPTATRTTVDGHAAVAADMLILFHPVRTPPPGAWNHELHRSDPQSSFWHIGAYTNTTDMKARLGALGIVHLPLFTAPDDEVGVWRSGLAPYAGTRTAAQLGEGEAEPPREGGFSYVVAPDGALFEFTGGPDTRDSFSHVHLFNEHPMCAANWYAEVLGMTLPSTRSPTGERIPGQPADPCEEAPGEAGWPSLEPGGTIRSPRASASFDGGSLSWYPRQCAGRCAGDPPHSPSRGQVLDHVAFEIDAFDAVLATLRARGVTILEGPYSFDGRRAILIEDPDRLAIELVARQADAPVPPFER